MLKAISGWDGLDWDAWTLECTPSMSVAPPMMHVVSIKFSVYSADSSKTLLKLVFYPFQAGAWHGHQVFMPDLAPVRCGA